MAIRHGNKTYMQILLDPHRAKLLFDLAEKASTRPTAWIRNAVYKALEREYPAAVYNEAVAKMKLLGGLLFVNGWKAVLSHVKLLKVASKSLCTVLLFLGLLLTS